MANLPETLASQAGNLKTVYSDVVTVTFPDFAVMQKRFPLNENAAVERVGDYLSVLTALQPPQGHSFLGVGNENTDTNVVLGDAIRGQTLPAQVYPSTYVLRDQIQSVLLDRAAERGPTAVMSSLGMMSKQMALQARNILELQILHGREGLGAASANIATLTVTLDAATTSPGILSVLLGARVQFFQSNLTTARTAHDSSNYLSITAVDVTTNPDAPTITLTATGTTGVANIVTGDVMFIGGSRGVSVAAGATSVPFYEQIGMGIQLSQVSGLLFNINKSNYVGWVANVLPSIGQFSPSALMLAAGRILGRGGEMGNYLAVVSPRAWAVLNAALATGEVYFGSSSSMSKKSGTDEIVIKHDGITVEVIGHPGQKDGRFYLFPEKQFARVGSTDLTFSVPGRSGSEEYLYPVADRALMESQCRADFQGFLIKPNTACIGTGITY